MFRQNRDKQNNRLVILPFLIAFLLPCLSMGNALLSNGVTITVLDAETNEPIIGANIYTEDFSFNTTTDFNGQAILADLKYRDMLTISYIGYKSMEMPFYELRRKRGGIIRMEVDAIELSGVEIVGRRDDDLKEMPYKIERVSSKAIAFSNAQTSADLLEKNAGLFVQKTQMGGGSPVIRGFEANRVLLVVDGVRMNNAIYRSGHLQNAITIDAASLEQAEVIYGPGSLIYGSDALGGVVHYRTKDPKLALGEDQDRISEANAYLRVSSANTEKAIHVDFNQGGKKWGSFSSFSFVDYGDLKAGSNRPEAYPRFGLREYFAAWQPTKASVVIDNSVEEGGNPNRQEGTEYGQIDFLQKIKFQPTENLYFVANFQYSSTGNIPRYDNLVDTLDAASRLKWVDWYYGPQQRILGSLKTRILDKKVFDKGTIIAAYQRVDEDQHRRRFARSWRSSTETDVHVFSLTADFDKYLDEAARFTISYGLDWSKNIVDSWAYERNVRTGQTHRILLEGSNIISRYPSQGSSMDSFGGYINTKWKSASDKLNLEAGLRYSTVELGATFGETDPIQWPQNYLDGIFVRNSAMTFGTGFTYQTDSKWQFRGLAATAFRSPNIDDFAKIREKNGFVTIPNPSLAPEKAFTIEGTIAKEFGGINRSPESNSKSGTSLILSITGFRTQLRDAIVSNDFALPDGSNTLLKDGDLLETRSNVNAETATVQGVSGNLKFSWADKWLLTSSINYTQGESRFQDELEGITLDTMVPFAHIPPMYGQTSLDYQTEKLRLSGVIRYNGRKRPNDYAIASARVNHLGQLEFEREGTSDNLEYTPYGPIDANGDPCTLADSRGDEVVCEEGFAGSLAWTTFNLYGEYQLNTSFSINFGIENITDLHYRTFSSGVSAPGRNFILGIRGKF